MTNHIITQPILPQTEDLTVNLPIEDSIKLEDVARTNGCPKAEIIRDALRYELYGVR